MKYPDKWIETIVRLIVIEPFRSREDFVRRVFDALNELGALNLPKKDVIYKCGKCGHMTTNKTEHSTLSMSPTSHLIPCNPDPSEWKAYEEVEE